MSPTSIMSIPEEILEHVLAISVFTDPDSLPRPSWHVRSPAKCTASVLLVNKTFLRIATPLLYRTLVLRSPAQLSSVLNSTFKPNPELATHVRTIILSGGDYQGFDHLIHLCHRLETFDMTLDNKPWEDKTKLRFGESLRAMKGLKHLVIRKDAYLSQEKPKYIISQLSQAIPKWDSLETVNVKFRLSSDKTTLSFASALSAATNLKSFRTLLPAVWNPTLLIVSQNPNLQRIHLSPDNELIGSHLFLTEARKHNRLMDLIKAGTPIMRIRAHSSPATTMPLLPIPIKMAGVTSPSPAPSAPPRRLSILLRW